MRRDLSAIFLSLVGVIVSCFGILLCFSLEPARAAQVDAWEIKQVTDHFGPATLLATPDAMKFVSNGGDLVVVTRGPDWKVVAFNKSEKLALEMPLEQWPGNGLKMFKGSGDAQNAKPTTVFDPVLKLKVLQREVPLQGRFFGSNDPAIFRAAEKKQLLAMRLRVSTNIPINEAEKKVLQGIYSLPFAGGFPLELATLTTDGGASYIYRTLAVDKKKVDDATFSYPSGYKVTKDRFAVYVTTKQKKRFEDFLDAFTDDAQNEKKKSEKK